MANDYILTLEGHNVFREVELAEGEKRVRIGTGKQCDVRFRKDLFFSPFELELSCDDGGAWSVSCSDEIYFGTDGVGKAAFKQLQHGDEFVVRYADSSATLFSVRFAIDFERGQGAYDRSVDLSGRDGLSIGGKPNCELRLRSPYVEDDLVVLRRNGQSFELVEQNSRYGVLCDGKRVSGSVQLEDMMFFSMANFFFYYKEGRIYFSQHADIVFNGVAYRDEPTQRAGSAYPRFNRNTRVKTSIPGDAIPVLDPPQKQEKPKQNIIVQLLPAVGMLAVVVLLRGTMGDSGGSSFVLMSAATMGVGILATVLGIVTDRRQYKADIAAREEKYTNYIDAKREDVRKARSQEHDALVARYVPQQDELEMVADFSSDLFDRGVGDDDFLHVLLGVGRRESARQVDYKHKEALDVDELAELPSELHDSFEFLENAPIVVDLAHNNAVGIVGTREKRRSFMRNAVVDLATRHYPDDVKLFLIAEEANADEVMWARMLPHVRNNSLNCWNIVCDEDSRNALFEHLYKGLTARQGATGAFLPHIVLFVLDDCGLKNHPLSQFVGNANELGATFLFFERAKEDLPLGCDSIITLVPDAFTGVMVTTGDGRQGETFSYSPVAESQAASMANALAPVYCEEVSLEGALTKSISLFELLGIISADDLDLSARWASTAVDRSLAAPIGVTKSKVVDLDLHDKAHGPHGLVAGTTGSGKSEILQTYILSIATLFHPYEVSFLIIDFKGGGMVNQFRDLPHLAGAITNIDGREIDRSLKSIKAELQKRQRLFAEADVNHISNYIRKYKAGGVSQPLPHLIIVVDEFAELKAEQPEFMKELISASRIGRSLGVHLILATQKPSGQVNEQIWSNSRFKLCLKVQSKEDSNEVIKSPLAAEIKEPGRAYLQVGNNEIFELFQSGFSGAPEREGDDTTKEYDIYRLENYGKRVPVFAKRRKKSDAVVATQLDAIVAHVARYCESQAIEHLPSICLPPLAETVDFPATPLWKDGSVALGVYDDPDSQYQGEAYFDIDSTNAIIVGSSQMGKTNLLQGIVRAIAQTKTPDEAAIYIMDFASMVLKNFEGLGHVGGVVLPGEDEKVKNLFKLLNGELAVRKSRMLEAGVSSFAAYLEAGYHDMPHVYVMIDNFAVFKELYADAYEDDFITLCRDGLAYGVSVIVANSVTSGLGYRHLSNFSTHIALTCNDTGEYSALFDKCHMEPKNVPGRALCSFDKELYEFQAYLAFAGEREIDRVRAIGAFADSCNARCGGKRVRAIPSVPDDLSFKYLAENYASESNEMLLALSYATVEPVRINLNSQFSLAVVGKDERKRIAVVRAMLAEIHESIFDRPVEVRIVDGIMRELQDCRNLPYVRSYDSDPTALADIMEDVSATLGERYQSVSENGFDALDGCPYLVVIVNSAEAVEYLSESKDLMALYTTMAKQHSAMRALFVFAAVGDSSVSYSSPELLKAIRDERRAFIVSDMADHKFFDIPSGVARAYRVPLEANQAFFVDGADVVKVKIAAIADGE